MLPAPRLLRPAIVLATVALATAGLGACTGDSDDDRPPATAPTETEVRVDWEQVALPDASPGRRIAVRAAAWCGDRWVIVGGLLGPGDASRPAAWTSSDARSWEAVRLRTSTYWGGRAVLSTVACRGTQPVAVGAMSGGAHGNPRVVTFTSEDRGAWVDVSAPFEQYGGPSAVNVGPVASGDAGWLITGNRRTGPCDLDRPVRRPVPLDRAGTRPGRRRSGLAVRARRRVGRVGMDGRRRQHRRGRPRPGAGGLEVDERSRLGEGTGAGHRRLRRPLPGRPGRRFPRGPRCPRLWVRQLGARRDWLACSRELRSGRRRRRAGRRPRSRAPPAARAGC